MRREKIFARALAVQDSLNYMNSMNNVNPLAAIAVPTAVETRFLERLETLLARTVSGMRSLETGARHAVFSGGKRARPLFAHRFAEVTHPPDSALLDAAAAIELIHAASLVHDDILDRAERRRGLPTVAVAFGTDAAVLTGDLLLARALGLLSPYPHEIAAAARAFEEICHAATIEWQSRQRIDFPADAWLSMAEGKTGALFGLSAYVAASLAGDRERALRYDKAARALGIAFQMADDLSDLLVAGGEEDAAQDLAQGNPSYPILLALQSDPALAAMLERAWHEPTTPLAPLLERVVTTRVRRDVERAILDYVDSAAELVGRDLNAPSLKTLFLWSRELASVASLPLTLA